MYDCKTPQLCTVAALSTRFPTIQGVIVGGGAERELRALRGYAAQQGVDDLCRIPGKVPYVEVVDWINSFDLAIVLDMLGRLKMIGSSNQKIRQYLACGKPVVAGIGTSDFIRYLDLGVVVDPESGEDFIASVVALLSKTFHEKHDLAARAREYAEKHFDIDELVDRRIEHW